MHIEGVECYIDDILVWGQTQEEHDTRLRAVLNKCRQENLTLNKMKCKVSKASVKYIGHELLSNGLAPNRDRIQSVLHMTRPTSKEDIQSFIGFATYLSKFNQNLSEATKPLRDVLKKNIQFFLEKPQEDAFLNVKELVTRALVLKLSTTKKTSRSQ